jgi:small nuclear ribonucleoprotein (snRNP)-like protein
VEGEVLFIMKEGKVVGGDIVSFDENCGYA